MPEHFNRVTVLDKDGDRAWTDLTDWQAEDLASFMGNTDEAPRQKGGPRTPEEIAAIDAREREYGTSANLFSDQIKRFAALDPRDLARIMALVDLIEFGDGTLSGGNWMLEVIHDFLRDVQWFGPAAALEKDPREILSSIAADIGMFWNWMNDGKHLQKRHPSLFKPEPPAAPETTTRPAEQPAKTQRARKPRKKVAHA